MPVESALHVETWGVFAACGVLAALYLWLRAAKRNNLKPELAWDAALLGLFGVILGGRGAYLLLSGGGAAALLSPGGFSLAGGAILAGILVVAYLRMKREDVFHILDAFAPGIALALIFVRLGCLLVNDHVGRLLPASLQAFFGSGARHPVALYHILFLVAIFFAVRHNSRKKHAGGEVFFFLAVSYAAASFLADFSRCADLPVCDARFTGLTASQWLYAAFLILAPFLRRRFLSAASRAVRAEDPSRP